MKRLFLIITFHCGLGLLLQSCIKCPDYRIIDIQDMRLYGVIFPAENNSLDTIRGDFYLDVNFGHEVAYNYDKEGFGITTAYAWSCRNDYVNALVPETASFSFDKPFKLLGDSIPANTNLLQHSLVKEHITADLAFVEFTDIYFDSTFYDNAVFDIGIIEMEFKVETNDGIPMSERLVAFMDL